ncbi:hypothetical protein GGD67_005984 [Bradyrhizobium sp. IAR9]|uniref:hypothetical protein n=1 Tax=Bradyrhizobium sp. IAR9 TaxID=2663841 RepID=UPI0015CC9B85|nr:hypothetical protein [Bradyrhizobium sp. IAR9]NYG48499.1 hypothetical protein [Bradyrhizobium sp. IAR9]
MRKTLSQQDVPNNGSEARAASNLRGLLQRQEDYRGAARRSFGGGNDRPVAPNPSQRRPFDASRCRSNAGTSCSATCQTHFGNFRNLYRLLGYTPKRNYEFLDSRPVWSQLRARLVEQAATAIKAAGGRISSGGWSDCLRVNGTTYLSVRAARWTPGRKPNHAPHWSIERETCLPDGWIAAIRLSEHNKTVLDYVLLPTDGKVKRTIRFSEAARAGRGIIRFKP